jgi:hypothetical protein
MSAPEPDFAPANPTDGRQLLDWHSKYTDPAARRGIRYEACYLAALFFGAPALVLVFWLEYPKGWLQLSDARYRTLLQYAIAWIGGMFGGTLFDIKWLYHSVAKQVWHLDRRLWRVFTPHVSGGLSCAVVALISSGLLRVFDRHATESSSLVFGLAFLVGYFSDSTIAKLAEVAGTLFGPIHIEEKKATPPKGSGND